jgi:DNA-binding CsgD family transcriptional regulator
MEPIKPFTKREKEVIELLKQKKTSKQIANILFISKRTVEVHRLSIRKKLGFPKMYAQILTRID